MKGTRKERNEKKRVAKMALGQLQCYWLAPVLA